MAVTVPSISFTHIDNSSYVARHYSEDLTTEKFISLVGESARTIAAENDLYASVMIAQAILESASGNSTLAQAPNNNLFGIKGTYHGNSVQLPTREDDGTGATYTIMSDFRQYETVDESLSDYADLLSNSMGDFYAGARKSNSDSFVDACDFLVGRYATDIFYSEKLQDLIETYDLTRFDVPLTYELTDTFVLPVKDEVTGLDKYLDPVTDKAEYEALVARVPRLCCPHERVPAGTRPSGAIRWRRPSSSIMCRCIWRSRRCPRPTRRCSSIRMPSTPSASRASIRSSPRASPCRCARPAR